MLKKEEKKNSSYVIGLDYGTDSVRALLVDANTGDELGSSVFEYPRWKKGLYCDSSLSRFRQHPLDYIEGLEHTIGELSQKYPEELAKLRALSVATTASTPVAVNKEGVPLSLLSEFSENPNAMFVLWKDHTAIKEAEDINTLARTWGGVDFTKYSGGIYSSEWFWAKILHIFREDEELAKVADSFLEQSDWLPALLVGGGDPRNLRRNRCAAGHKALWHSEWGGFPPERFWERLDTRLVKIRRSLNDDTLTSDMALGTLCEEWATRLGLSTSVVVGSGSIDAHVGAVGGEIKPYYLSKVIGTSTCDMLFASKAEMQHKLIRGICGQVDGSIVPDMIGMEAGQSAFGDIYAWFCKLLLWPIESILLKSEVADSTIRVEMQRELESKIMLMLSEAAEKIPVSESGVLALDWLNGRRTPDANQTLKGLISGLNLGTDAPRIFRSLIEATAFGSKAILERFISEGIRIDGILALGGIAQKSSLVMQILTDVLNRPIYVVASKQTCALGAAMWASVVGDIHPTISIAQEKMGKGISKTYYPDATNVEKYEVLYRKYLLLGNFIEKASI